MKIYKELIAIRLKDGRIITTENPLEVVAEMLNTRDFVVIGDIGFSKFEVRSFEKFKPNELENFIYSKPREISEKLQKILEERKTKGFETRGPSHLWEIYIKIYGDGETH